MRLAQRHAEKGLLTSKVARRVFILFVLCALVPATALAFASFFQVHSELANQAEIELRRSAKATGLGLFDRLLFLDADLRRIVQSVDLDNQTPGPLDATLLGESTERFSLLSLLSFESPVDAGPAGHPIDLRRLDSLQRDRLEEDRALVLTRSDEFGSSVVSILRPTRSPGKFFLATVRPEYLWGTDASLVSSAHLLILNRDGDVLYSTEDPASALAGWNRRGDEESRRVDWSRGEQHYAGAYWTLFMRHDFGTEWTIVNGVEDEVAFAALDDFRWIFLLVFALGIVVVLALSLSQIRRQLIPIAKLAFATRRLSERDFSARVDIKTGDEFAELGQSFNSMAGNLEHYLGLVKTSNELGTHLSAERDPDVFLDMIIRAMRRVTRADGSVIYTLDEDGGLDRALFRVGSLGLQTADRSRLPIPPASENRAFLDCFPFNCNRVRRIENLKSQKDPLCSMFAEFETENDYQVESLLSLPLRNHEAKVIGMVHLFNKIEDGCPVPFADEDEEVAQSLTTQAAVSLTKNRLVGKFQGLFESMTELITVAIDEKSPYTGAHCQRVPIITMMLAEATCQTKDGGLAKFNMTPDELYELKIAALLHDCGKVTTPVHVVDKATKLETIFDRVELLETRFQALKQERRLAHAESPASQIGELREELQRIDSDLAFLKQCNVGTERMSPGSQERVRAIAESYRWESPHGQMVPILTDDEVENLTVSHGTLNDAEREIINYHVVATSRMLEKLTYPKNLGKVPEIAGNHHEMLDGSGYPRGIGADDLSTQSRILSFADVFEALTANDRPYKDGRKLSEVFRILDNMTREGQLDRDLFEVFIRERAYVKYAEEFLDPVQIDGLDFDHFLDSSDDRGLDGEVRKSA